MMFQHFLFSQTGPELHKVEAPNQSREAAHIQQDFWNCNGNPSTLIIIIMVHLPKPKTPNPVNPINTLTVTLNPKPYTLSPKP